LKNNRTHEWSHDPYLFDLKKITHARNMQSICCTDEVEDKLEPKYPEKMWKSNLLLKSIRKNQAQFKNVNTRLYKTRFYVYENQENFSK